MELPDWIPKEAWAAFLEMRKSKKNPLNTDRMITRQINRLDGFRKAGYSVEESLDASTNARWDDTYAPKPAMPVAAIQGARPGESDEQFRLRARKVQDAADRAQSEPEKRTSMPAAIRDQLRNMIKSKIVH